MQITDTIQNALRQGSEEAFSLVFHEYYSLLCAVAYQYVKDVPASESLAEDALCTLWERRSELLPLHSLRGWLLRAVRNRSIDHLRSIHADRQLDIETAARQCFVADDDVFERYVRMELEREIEAHVNALPTECQQVFRMSRYDGMTYNEIAQRLGISVNTVKYHIKNALTTLRRDLKPYLKVAFDLYVLQYFS